MSTAEDMDLISKVGYRAAVADPLETVPPTGMRLDTGYQVDKVIGVGAAGRVWRGRRDGDGRSVAVKVLHPQFSADPEIVTRFVREHATLQRLDHPHLVRVFDLVCAGDIRAIVMELVEGENLRKTAARGVIDPDRAVTVLVHMADALAYIHAAGIVHRDVKPENMLVTWRAGDPWTQLTDFGIAHIVGGAALTRHDEIVGTPAYVAPEVALNRPAGAASDVYALGITAYELLAGRRPFVAENPMALLRAHVDDEPPRPSTMDDGVWRVVRACLAKEPAARPESATLAGMLRELSGRMGALPLHAPPPVPVTVTPPAFAAPPPPLEVELPTAPASRPAPPAPPPDVPARGRRRRVWLWAAAGLALVVLAGAGGVWLGRERAPATGPTPTAPALKPQLWYLPITATSPSRGTIRLDFADATGLPGFDSYVIFLDGQKYAQVSPGDAPPFTVSGRHPGTKNCYRVAALVLTDRPRPPEPEATCLEASP